MPETWGCPGEGLCALETQGLLGHLPGAHCQEESDSYTVMWEVVPAVRGEAAVSMNGWLMSSSLNLCADHIV